MVEFSDKVFIIHKSRGPTSFDIVEAFRRATRLRKVGHAGTLDPMAEGVLIVCTGKATRAVGYLMELDKTYDFEIVLGIGTSTLDEEGGITEETSCPELSREEIASAASSFLGDYLQEPPAFSALKRGGKKLYELARAGESPRVEKRMVMIHRFEVVGVSLPVVSFSLTCSRGTYVRSLAKDLGRKLGLPAHVKKLVRTRVGSFGVEDAYPDSAIYRGDVSTLEGIELARALNFLPAIVVNEGAKRALLSGIAPSEPDVLEKKGKVTPGSALSIIDEKGTLIAVGEARDSFGRTPFIINSYRLFVDAAVEEPNGES